MSTPRSVAGAGNGTVPSVSVIVPVRGPAPGLEACLKALGAQTLPPSEVILVDNGLEGGPDRARRILPGSVVIGEERVGSYAARNAGLRRATGKVVAFTDSDCVPDPTWLEEILAALGGSQDSVVAGAVEVRASDPAARTPAEVLEMAFAFPQEVYVRRQGFGVTANLAASRAVFESVGPFREDLLSGGDFEWGRRAAEHGFITLFEGRARVRHRARRHAEELEEKERRVTRGICHLAQSGAYGPGRLLRLVLWTLSPPAGAGWILLTRADLGPPGMRLRALGLLLRLKGIRLRVLWSHFLGGASP